MLCRRSATTVTSVALMYLASPAYSADHAGHAEQHSHVHGVAELMLAQEGRELEIMLESPAANIVGFEHKATSAEHIALVEQAEALLEAPLKLFSFNGACKVSEVELDMASVEPDDHDHKDKAHHDHKEHHAHHDEHDHEEHDHDKHDHDKHDHDEHDHEEHASSHGEISAHYHFICQSGDVTAVTLNLKQYFPAIETLSVSWITEQGQGAVSLKDSQLTGSQRTVRFR